ncbi:LOW QUALITY PROTEIN: hypothetical protein PanWU01x14_026100, partial [Parasponia andersonii]
IYVYTSLQTKFFFKILKHKERERRAIGQSLCPFLVPNLFIKTLFFFFIVILGASFAGSGRYSQ